MKLYEFFGNISHDIDQDKSEYPNALGNEEEQELEDQLFWFIIDHDDLHKKYALPNFKEIKNKHQEDEKTSNHDWKMWMPMVKNGCAEFYKEQDIKGDPRDFFNKEVRINLCKRLVDHFHKDIINDEYKIGR